MIRTSYPFLALLMLTLILAGCGRHPDSVAIPDPLIERAIRSMVNKPRGPITSSDMEKVNELHIEAHKHILGRTVAHSLEGLQYAKNLTHLFISVRENYIQDLSPLAGLENLTEVYLHDTRVSDVSPLANLTNLKILFLHGTISDLSPLANLPNLVSLSTGDQISDVSPLANLTNLTYLFLEGQISDISPLTNLTSLTYLSLPGNQINDVSPLVSLVNLTDLSLGANRISDLSPFASLSNLKFLHLEENHISDISPLVHSPALQEHSRVYLSHNCLDLTVEGTQAMEDIRALVQRGVSVSYRPQRHPC